MYTDGKSAGICNYQKVLDDTLSTILKEKISTTGAAGPMQVFMLKCSVRILIVHILMRTGTKQS